MGTSVSVEVIGLPQLQARIDPARLRAALAPALRQSGELVQAEAKAKAPKDTDTLQGSITYQVDAAALAVEVGTNLGYAPYVHGWMDNTAARSKPHWPPIAAITPWAQRHGIAPFLVARAIARRGTPLVPFLRQARDDNRERVRQLLRDAVGQFTGRP